MAGVIDADYTGEVRVVLANQGDQEYSILKGDKIAQLIIEKIVEDEYQEVEELDSTTRGDQGFGSTDEVSKKSLQIREITAKEFGCLHREGAMTGILKWRLIEGNDIRFERINVSTELAIQEKQRRQPDEGKKKVPTEYHDYLDLFQESEATGLPPHRDGVDLQIHFKPGETRIPDKKLYPLGENELEEIRNYLKQNLKRGWIRESFAEGASPILFIKKKDGKLRLCVDYRGLNEITRKD